MDKLCISKHRASKCVSHHFACDCREYRYRQMQDALVKIMIWADHDLLSGEDRNKAMRDIANACGAALNE